MKAAKAGLPADGILSGGPTVIEPAEGSGMCACLCVRGVRPVKSLSCPTSALSVGAMIEVRSARTKTVAIDDRPAVRDVGVVVVDDSPVVVPIVSPVVPTPAESAK